MNRIFISVSLMLIICSNVLSGLAIGQDRSQEVENSRFKDACPLVSERDRRDIELLISNVRGDELREFFGEDALPLDARVEPLTDSEHGDVCQYLTRVHKSLISSKTRRPEKAEELVYKYSVAYLEAGSFYFVVIGINPERLGTDEKGFDRVVLDQAAGTRVHFKDNMDLVSDRRFVFGPEHRKLTNDRIRERLESQR